MNFFYTYISESAMNNALQVLRSGWLSEGKMVKEFESALETQMGFRHAVAVNSGTSALHLALAVCGIGAGDEVILPAQTFIATGLTILMQGAIPVFADIDERTGNISPESIRMKITSRTKAIMPVHWGGYPCDMDEINAIAREHDLTVIEDAAHAFGATYKGKPIGTLSRFTAFSFQAIKHLTTGDGGALCCIATDDHEQAQRQRWFGIDRMNSKPSILGERMYDVSSIGYKYHMNDLAAAVGLGNLGDFSSRIQRRRSIALRYRKSLNDISGLQLLDYKDDREGAYWLFTVLVDRREDFIKKLQAEGIPTSVVHLRIDHNSVFGTAKLHLPQQELFNRKQIAIPVHDNLSEADVEHIIHVIKSGW